MSSLEPSTPAGGDSALAAAEHIAAICDECAAGVDSWYEISVSLERQAPEAVVYSFYVFTEELSDDSGASPDLLFLASAFKYRLKVDLAKRSDLNSAFAPMMTFTDGRQFPPGVRETPQSVIALWRAVAEKVTHPANRSRLNDLIFVRGESGDGSNVGVSARRSIDAYIELASAEWNSLEQSESLLRAQLLARATKDEPRAARVAEAVSRAYWEKLGAREGPGVTLPLIHAALRNVENLEDFSTLEINRMLAAALNEYEDPHIQDQLVSWQMQVSQSPQELQKYAVDRVLVWVNAAARTPGQLLKVMHLETAERYVEATADHGLKRLVRNLLQEAGAQDLDLKPVSAGISLPSSEVEAYLFQFTEPASWQAALDLFSTHPPLTGNFEVNRKTIIEIEQFAPLQAITPRVILGGDGLPRWRAHSEEEREDERLARHEVRLAQVQGALLAEGFRRMGAHYQRPTRDELAAHIRTRPTLASGTAEQLATAIDLFWSGEEGAAAYIAVWQVEALARALLLAANQGIYRTQRNDKPGQYPGLGALLKELRGLGLDMSWFRYLWTVFASPAGMNLRNEMAHGFAGPAGGPIAALSLHAANFLTILKVTTP